MFKKTAFIVNPNAAKGRVGREWAHIRHMASGRLEAFDEHLTTGVGDAVHLTRQAILDGTDRIVCVGGDGTLNEAVNGLMDEEGPLREGVTLGFIPMGTGCDFKKSAHLPDDPGEALDLVCRTPPRPMDLGKISFIDHRGRPVFRFFHNVASLGLGGEVDDRVNRTSKVFGGLVSFIWATLVSVIIYEKKRIHLKVDGDVDDHLPVLNVVVANGKYHGGGMWVAPDAVMDDGLFQVTVIGDFSLPEVFRHFPKLYNGKLFRLEKVKTFTGRHIEVRSEERVLLDVDGEQPGILPTVIDIMPRVISFILPS